MDKLKITAPERSALRVWRAEHIFLPSGALDNPACNWERDNITPIIPIIVCHRSINVDTSIDSSPSTEP